MITKKFPSIEEVGSLSDVLNAISPSITGRYTDLLNRFDTFTHFYNPNFIVSLSKMKKL